MIFYLVRHGQTDWNHKKRIQGHRNIPMNETGVQQMNELADRIVQEEIRFDKLISSTLERAKQSAEILAEKTGFQNDIIFDEDFIERSFGRLEGKIWRPWFKPEDPRYGMETVKELCDRARRALDKYTFSEDEKIMIVSHGAFLTAVRAVLSDYKIDCFDRTVPVVQGNILCCVKEKGKETIFFNLF